MDNWCAQCSVRRRSVRGGSYTYIFVYNIHVCTHTYIILYRCVGHSGHTHVTGAIRTRIHPEFVCGCSSNGGFFCVPIFVLFYFFYFLRFVWLGFLFCFFRLQTVKGCYRKKGAWRALSPEPSVVFDFHAANPGDGTARSEKIPGGLRFVVRLLGLAGLLAHPVANKISDTTSRARDPKWQSNFAGFDFNLSFCPLH